KDVTACIGSVATIEVVAVPLNATYVWRKNGSPIVPPETNSVLTIASVSASDGASYDVLVSDGVHTLQSNPAILTTNDVPPTKTQPRNQSAPAGSTATFTVVATGDGTLEYQWKKQTSFAWNTIPGAIEPTLTIQNVSASDSGRYRCHVSNHCGQ